MLMKRRSLPSSPLIWVPRAGNVWSISAIRAGRFCAAESNCLRPSVWRVKAAGRVTLIAMRTSNGSQFGLGSTIQLPQIGIEVSQAGANGALFPIVSGQRVSRFKTVASDAGNSEFIGGDPSVSIETGRDRSGNASGGFREDAFSLCKLLHTGYEFYIGDIFSPASRSSNHLRGGWAIGRVADRKGTSDSVGPLGFNEVIAQLHGLRDGRTAGSLGAKEANMLLFYKTKVDQFLEGLADLADER